MYKTIHQQELQSLTDQVNQQNSYAVSYGKSHYIGRALEKVGDFFQGQVPALSGQNWGQSV